MKTRVHRYCPKCQHHEMKKAGKRHTLYWCQRCGTPSARPMYFPEVQQHELGKGGGVR